MLPSSMRSRRALIALCALATAAGLHAQDDPGSDTDAVKRVEVTAEGIGREDAIRQALRQALEKGAGAEIASFSTVENFELIRDTIYSRATGLITDYRVTGERALPGGVVEVTVVAQVRPSIVAATWGEVQNALDQIGRPRIVVVINEYIDGRKQDDSIVAARIEELFTKVGFELLDRKAFERLGRLTDDETPAGRDAEQVAKVAQRQGAHILIEGTAHANRAGLEDLYGVVVAFYNCDVTARVYWTDTAKLITSESLPVTRQGVRGRKEFNPQAARAALVAATFPERRQVGAERPLAERLLESVLANWSEQVTAGGEVVLNVKPLSFRDFVRLRGLLQELERVERVDADFTDNSGLFRLRTTRRAAELAERLLTPPFERLLEVTDLKTNRIEATAKPEATSNTN